MNTVRSSVLLAAALAALAASGCAREGQEQMSWARAALERNAQLEILAADPQNHTFTVRVKDSGEVRTVRADEVMAAPLAASSNAAASITDSSTAAPSIPPAAAAPPETSTTNATASAAAEPAPESYEPASAAVPPPVPAKSGAGHLLESGPGYSIEAASGPQTAAVAQSGPGYSVKTAGPTPAGATSRGSLRDAAVTNAVLERRREPIVCQGERMLHIDNRNLEFDGDAVSAQDGCEIYITNSHISATGIGVLARNANVHIDNSLIEGDAGSIDASEGAQVYAASSHFRGLSRRLDSSAFHDQGGNIWN
jgi:hypothetical protein